MRNSRRASRVVTFAAAGVVLACTVLTATTSSAAPSSGAAADPHCRPAHVHDAGSVSARLERVPDQKQYSLRQLRRIDRRLDRAVAQARSSGASSRARSGLVLRIPVHAHVIDGDHANGPSLRAVRGQIDVLNAAFGGGQSRVNASTHFRFYLASFDRSRNQRWYTASLFDASDKQLRRRLHEGGPEALNLYFSAPHSPRADSVVLGWSTVPWRAERQPRLDGVTVHQESLRGGDLRRYNRGDTTVHEVGHWLGLFHTFEGGCSAGNDRVDDTAAEAQPSLTCEVGRDTCDADGLDPVRNFMNYSFDSCMNMFTPGQVSRMTDNWLAYRTP
ncbi:MAG TPA: zinc metalloprotease [Nocardioidaceae bacterium]|nr:zinc metalloprotease [Nocardioidaceae bacterium]